MSGCPVPVVLIAFNRPDKVRRLLELLAPARPARLFVVIDGPRRDHPKDEARCREVVRLFDDVTWPCHIERQISDTNLGCDARIISGLDWVFGIVEQAIVLEDDLIPHPDFIGWCADLLTRYRDDASIHCVAGRNDLVVWGDGDDDHVLINRGSNLGFGTWRRAWQAARAVSLPGPDGRIAELVAEGIIDPAVAGHFEWLRSLSKQGFEHGWDTRWELQRALLGGLSAVSTINLVIHDGFGEDATHPHRADALRALQPIGAPRKLTGHAISTVDHRLDRWTVFLHLLESCRDPRMARRLALRLALVPDANTRHHLTPFAPSADTEAALRHLRAAGCRSERLDALIAAFEPPAPSRKSAGAS